MRYFRVYMFINRICFSFQVSGAEDLIAFSKSIGVSYIKYLFGIM